MKKTIIVLFALAGIAGAVEPSAWLTVNDAGNGLTVNKAAGISDTLQLWNHNGTVTYDKTAGTFTTNGKGDLQILDSNGSSTTLNLTSLSYSFDASWTENATGDSILTTIGIYDGGYANRAYRFAIVDDTWTIQAGPDNGANKALTMTKTTAVTATTGEASYIVSSEVDANGKVTLNMYEDGTLIVSEYCDNGYSDGGYGMNMYKIGLGGCTGTADNAMAATFSNVKIYNQVIPEPTTATLSLLALAGLDARRRRK